MYSQLAFLEDLMADAATGNTRTMHLEAVVDHAREAVRLAPNDELSSLQLFHGLTDLGRPREAFEEALRFLNEADSNEYRSMLSRRHAEEQDPEIARLATTVRGLLARHAASSQ